MAWRLLNCSPEVTNIADNTKKAIFLELRQKQLAMGHIVRSYSDFHLFDPKKLV